MRQHNPVVVRTLRFTDTHSLCRERWDVCQQLRTSGSHAGIGNVAGNSAAQHIETKTFVCGNLTLTHYALFHVLFKPATRHASVAGNVDGDGSIQMKTVEFLPRRPANNFTWVTVPHEVDDGFAFQLRHELANERKIARLA